MSRLATDKQQRAQYFAKLSYGRLKYYSTKTSANTVSTLAKNILPKKKSAQEKGGKMNFSEFQKEIIKQIVSGKITNMATFLIEICRIKFPIEFESKCFIDIIQDNLIYCKPAHFHPYVLLPYSDNEVLGIFYEFLSLLHSLEIHNLVKTMKRPLPEALSRLECKIVVPKEDCENLEEVLDDATILLRENAKLIIVPNYNELTEFVQNSYKTIGEKQLQNERLYRNAQFWIALSIAFFTILFGIITILQNTSKESLITIKNKLLPIDTIVVKSIIIDNKDENFITNFNGGKNK